MTKIKTGVNPSSASTETVTAFVGRALRGPVNVPISLRSFADYQRVFGGLWQPSTLAYAVEQYFEHGGRHALVVRVVNGGAPTSISLPCGAATLTLEALAVGSREFLRASVDYDNLNEQDQDCFNLVVQRVRTHRSEHIEEQETYRRVSISPTTGRYVATVLVESNLVRVRGAVPIQRPEATPGRDAQRVVGYVDSNPDGNDGAPLTDYDLIGSAAERTGVFALSAVERIDFIYLPPLTRDQDVGLSSLLVASRFCRDRHAMLIVDPPQSWTDCQAALSGLRQFNFCCDQAVMFFPRLLIQDRLRGRAEVFANGGAVAGMLSHADEQRPVWDGKQAEPQMLLRPGVRLPVELSEIQRWRLAAQGVNTLQTVRRSAPVTLLRRTLAGSASAAVDWGYVQSRRFALHVMGQLARNTRWVLLASPSRSMWARIVRQINGFLHELVALGAFPGARPGQEFFVICDERINDITPDTAAEIRILVGFASLQTDQYHTFLITHALTGSHTRMVAVNRYETSSRFDDVELTNTLLALR
jgi:Bacteriophage tail sheath protein